MTKKKSTQIISLLKKSLFDLPAPSSISYLWNFGFLLGMIMMIQISSGILLSMLYISDTEKAFEIIVMIMKDAKLGWITRMFHMNGASLLFLLVYTHTARSIYFSTSENKKKVWFSGILILIMLMATAFLGYVLPWGQMSFWGATVITGVLSAIPMVGEEMMFWIWGGKSISQPTLIRFFSLHFILPMFMLMLVLIHLILLHEKGSSNSFKTFSNLDKIKFNPLFTIKDIFPLFLIMLFFTLLNFNFPNMLGDVENFNKANPMIAPSHIQPEWYFLHCYVILRSIPSKLGGVISLLASVLIISIFAVKKGKSSKHHLYKKMMFWSLISTVIILIWIGSNLAESPFEEIGKFYTMMYFLIILFL